MHRLVSVFKPAHQAGSLSPRLRAIADSNPKYLTKKLDAQLDAALLQVEKDAAERRKWQLLGGFKKEADSGVTGEGRKGTSMEAKGTPRAKGGKQDAAGSRKDPQGREE